MQLLISVRNVDEAELVSQCGVDIVDVKEPSKGSLGAASPEIFNQIARQFAKTCRLSLALGELLEFNHVPSADLRGYQFAKVGLAGCSTLPDWKPHWSRWAQWLEPAIRPVAVAYVDHHRCGAPAPQQIASHAASEGCDVFLLDTFFKQGSSLFDYISAQELENTIYFAQNLGMFVGVAGSVNETHLERIALCGANMIAVRGAVCQREERDSTIDSTKVIKFKEQILQLNCQQLES